MSARHFEGSEVHSGVIPEIVPILFPLFGTARDNEGLIWINRP